MRSIEPPSSSSAHAASLATRPLRLILAPQGLKGSLEAPDVAAAMLDAVRRVLPTAKVRVVPMADGGEGTVRALVAATSGTLHRVVVRGPLGDPVEAEYGILGATTGQAPEQTSPPSPAQETHSPKRMAVIEMAAASGLPLLRPDQRDPLRTSTHGTGELMRAALDAGCDALLIGIGGSATNDGGAGMAQALGASLLDAQGNELPPGGAALSHLARIDISHLDSRLAHVPVRVACDVTNPLLGPEGASAIYGPQKGATPAMVDELDAALARYADILKRDLGTDVARLPGAGAAGGLGAGLVAFAGATLEPGARLVLDAVKFEALLAGVDLVLTAEGRLDAQTAYGKSVAAVAAAAHRAGARVIVLAGQIDAGDETLDALSIDAALPLADGPLTLEESMARADELVMRATSRALRLVVLGLSLAHQQEPPTLAQKS